MCITPMFDSHGRLLTACFAPHQATAILADPDTLQVLSTYDLDVPSGNAYGHRKTGCHEVDRRQLLLSRRADRLTIVSGGKRIVTLVEAGSREPRAPARHTYDLASLIPEELQ